MFDDIHSESENLKKHAEEEQQTGQSAGGINISMTDPNGNEVYSGDVKKSGAMRAVRQLPKSAKGSAIRNIA